MVAEKRSHGNPVFFLTTRRQCDYSSYMKRITTVCILVLFCLLFASGPAAADTFRCRNVVFTDGDSRVEVLLKCGEPDFEEVVRETVSGEKDKKSGTFKKNTEYVVEWYYDCGEREFIKILTFKGGKLVTVTNSDSKGTGENRRDCR